MKKLVLISSIFILSFSACKTSKSLSKSAYEPAVNHQVETSLNEMDTEPAKVQEQAIVVRSESVSIERSNDHTLHAFYVIVGSFSMAENAYKLQSELLSNGIPSEVLKTETGMMRVSYLGTDREDEAREKVSEIRSTLPQFSDVWLLKRK
ncbi:MAG: SPOR domain-containing protein [Prolixibacteraceae bacterium]|nr:SPOR domain-containing protein [Prolixibacteraceae bacterium]